jgi:hypothetical protein
LRAKHVEFGSNIRINRYVVFLKELFTAAEQLFARHLGPDSLARRHFEAIGFDHVNALLFGVSNNSLTEWMLTLGLSRCRK